MERERRLDFLLLMRLSFQFEPSKSCLKSMCPTLQADEYKTKFIICIVIWITVSSTQVGLHFNVLQKSSAGLILQ